MIIISMPQKVPKGSEDLPLQDVCILDCSTEDGSRPNSIERQCSTGTVSDVVS